LEYKRPMRNLYFLLSTFLIAFPVTGQQFTEPDSAAIVKNHVKSVRIFYTGTGIKNYFTREYRYDKKGRQIYDQDGSANYHYEYSYNDKDQIVRAVQRGNDGKFIQGWENIYYPNGRRKEFVYYTETDTVFPINRVGYDTAGNKVSDTFYRKHEISRVRLFTFDSEHHCVSVYDSIPGTSVSVLVESRLSRISYYDDKHVPGTTWLFTHDSLGRLSKAILKTPGKKKDESYTIKYEANGSYSILLNGKPAGTEEKTAFENQFGYLLPRTGEDYELPYADPIAESHDTHTLTRDKKGNIIEDKIESGDSWRKTEPVLFTYEYTYY
jgi:hypothetical protein